MEAAKNSVIGHVDKTRLVSRCEFESRIYRHMIDGRTIFQYILFIEPVLRQKNPSLVHKVASRNKGVKFSNLEQDFFLISKPAKKESLAISKNRLVSIPVYLQLEQEGVFGSIESSVSMIDQHDLGFFVDLGISRFFIVMGDGQEQFGDPFDVNLDVTDISPLPFAVEILRQSARNFLSLWAQAESQFPVLGDDRFKWELLDDMRGIFAESVVVEFLTRMGKFRQADQCVSALRDKHFGTRDILDVLDYDQEFPLTRELVAYWLPLWNRAAVIFDSPFDFATELHLPNKH